MCDSILNTKMGIFQGLNSCPLARLEPGCSHCPQNGILIFYCANGGRSQWAASLAGEAEV